MNEYYNGLPRYVKIKNEKFIINTNYRIFVEFEKEMQGTDTKKAIFNALCSFYPAFSIICSKNLLKEAVDKFIWFYKCGKDDIIKNNNTSSAKRDQLFNYDYDADLIYGTYLIYAKIDLSKRIHWWKFKAVWNSLPSDCEFNKIKGYRAYNGKDEDILKLKEYYKLPPSESERMQEIKAQQIFEALK